jgi:hypothetical protein
VGTELKWVKAGDNDIVSLTGLTLLSDPHNTIGSFSTYLDENCFYCIDLNVNTKVSSEAYMSPASVADFGSTATDENPRVRASSKGDLLINFIVYSKTHCS